MNARRTRSSDPHIEATRTLVEIIGEMQSDVDHLTARLEDARQREAEAWRLVAKLGGDGWRGYANERARLALAQAGERESAAVGLREMQLTDEDVAALRQHEERPSARPRLTPHPALDEDIEASE